MSWRERARALFDRVPTRWLVLSAGGGLIGLSALFGGLEDAPPPVHPVIQAGETHEGSELAIAVDSALLIDAFPEQNLVPAAGSRLFVIRATVENTTAAARRLSAAEADTVRVEGVSALPIDEPPARVLVIDDGSDRAVAQPGVPVEVVFVWEIADGALTKGDIVTISILDRVFMGEGELTYGGLYGPPAVRATVQVPLGDVGAGVSE
jgi:hypothetical protein